MPDESRGRARGLCGTASAAGATSGSGWPNSGLAESLAPMRGDSKAAACAPVPLRRPERGPPNASSAADAPSESPSSQESTSHSACESAAALPFGDGRCNEAIVSRLAANSGSGSRGGEAGFSAGAPPGSGHTRSGSDSVAGAAPGAALDSVAVSVYVKLRRASHRASKHGASAHQLCAEDRTAQRCPEMRAATRAAT